jgi:hypothetical protein
MTKAELEDIVGTWLDVFENEFVEIFEDAGRNFSAVNPFSWLDSFVRVITGLQALPWQVVTQTMLQTIETNTVKLAKTRVVGGKVFVQLCTVLAKDLITSFLNLDANGLWELYFRALIRRGILARSEFKEVQKLITLIRELDKAEGTLAKFEAFLSLARVVGLSAIKNLVFTFLFAFAGTFFVLGVLGFYTMLMANLDRFLLSQAAPRKRFQIREIHYGRLISVATISRREPGGAAP